MSVKVGVRVRPFNQRQKGLNSKLCVDMIGPMTRLFNAEDPDKHRDFTFDFSFWSHDGYAPDEKGYFRPEDDRYADQQLVFQKVGLQILANAWEGYHCCLFAYGQTGAGKSYSMVGYGPNKGIVPISCQQIFRRISTNQKDGKEYEVNCSMLQIYNEKVQDLLIPMNKRVKQGLKIRQHKTLGIYVQGLSKHYVDNYETIETKMQQGNKNRSIGTTQMNANSSRAHTIISIEFKQLQIIENKKRQKLSVIHLVDLAGSQKAGKTGATGDRLDQANKINTSLTVLGLVISTLASKATGVGKNVVVPYRNSCLTRILQNALGGNSKTLMICAISPATDNYQETLSTLKYADQAKKIKNIAVINQSETDKIIRNLIAQKEQLKQKVQKLQEMFQKLGVQLDQNVLQQFNDIKQQLKFNNQMMRDYQMSKQQKKYIQQKERQQELKNKVDLSIPHLSNLSQDLQLSRKINYSFHQIKTRIGKRNAKPQNDIQIGGMGIRQLHAIIDQIQQKYFIESAFTGEDSGCYLNGNLLSERSQLKNLDRLIFGTNNVFIVIIPDSQPRQKIEQAQIDLEFALNQLYMKKQTLEREANQQIIKQIKEQTQVILKKKQEQLALLQKTLQESQELRKNIEQQKQIEIAQMEKKLRQQEAQKLRSEIQNQKRMMRESQRNQKLQIRDKYFFQKKLLKALPKCIELNLIAKQFKRNVSMSVKMLLPSSQEQQNVDLRKRQIKVKVINRQTGYCYWWDTVKLSNRYYIIKDMAEQYFETGNVPVLQKQDDPFWDPPEHVLIGRAFLTTKALAYMFDNPVNLTIIGQDEHCGTLVVNLVPTDQTGNQNLSQKMDEDIQFQPEWLIDKPFYFNIMIQQAKISKNYQNIYVQYTLKTDQYKSQTFRTNNLLEESNSSFIKYKMLHKFDCLSQRLLDFLKTSKLIFRVFGYETTAQQKKQIKKISNTPSRQSQKKIQKVEQKIVINQEENSGDKNIFQSLNSKKFVQKITSSDKNVINTSLKSSEKKLVADENKLKDLSLKTSQLNKKDKSRKDKDQICVIY